MDTTRRQALKTGGGVTLAALLAAAGWLAPREVSAQAWNKSAFDAKYYTPLVSDIVGVASSLPKTEAIAILIEKNPNMLAAVFEIPPGTEPSLSTRVKMAQTSNVHALVRADGRYFVATKEIKVTLGGCGG